MNSTSWAIIAFQLGCLAGGWWVRRYYLAAIRNAAQQIEAMTTRSTDRMAEHD